MSATNNQQVEKIHMKFRQMCSQKTMSSSRVRTLWSWKLGFITHHEILSKSVNMVILGFHKYVSEEIIILDLPLSVGPIQNKMVDSKIILGSL